MPSDITLGGQETPICSEEMEFKTILLSRYEIYSDPMIVVMMSLSAYNTRL